jgi:hypothetical protein
MAGFTSLFSFSDDSPIVDFLFLKRVLIISFTTTIRMVIEKTMEHIGPGYRIQRFYNVTHR